MGRTGVPSTHQERPAGVVRRFQLIEYPVDAASSDARDVLKTCPNRSDLADEADGLEEEPGSLAVDAPSLGVGETGVLTGRASDDDAGQPPHIPKKSRGGEFSNIVIGDHAFSASERNIIIKIGNLPVARRRRLPLVPPAAVALPEQNELATKRPEDDLCRVAILA